MITVPEEYRICSYCCRKGHYSKDCDMKVEYGQFRSMKKASSNLAFISSHYKDSKKQRGGMKRNSKDIQECQEIKRRYKYPIKSSGYALLQDSEDKEYFKLQRTHKKRHSEEVPDDQYFERRSKHPMTSLGPELVKDSTANEDFKQQRTHKKRHSKEAQDDQDLEKRSKHAMTSLGHSVLQDSAGNEDSRQQRTCKDRNSKESQNPIAQDNDTKTFVTTSPNEETKMSSTSTSTEDLPMSMCEGCTSLLNQYEKSKETTDNLRLEIAILIIEKGLIESSWDLFIKKVEEIDSIEALEQLKNRFVHKL